MVNNQAWIQWKKNFYPHIIHPSWCTGRCWLEHQCLTQYKLPSALHFTWFQLVPVGTGCSENPIISINSKESSCSCVVSLVCMPMDSEVHLRHMGRIFCHFVTDKMVFRVLCYASLPFVTCDPHVVSIHPSIHSSIHCLIMVFLTSSFAIESIRGICKVTISFTPPILSFQWYPQSTEIFYLNLCTKCWNSRI